MADEVRKGRARRARRGFLLACAGAATLLVAQGAAQAAPTPAPTTAPARARPNFIVIMADDLGFSDLGAYGGEVATPNLDGLASNGVRFDNFYNLSRCSPSRASLLTGRYAHRVNMGENGTSLSKEVPTVAEELRRAGYATSMVGKWHLSAAVELPDREEHLKWLNHQGRQDRDFADLSTYPAARGFERHYGPVWGVVDYYDPFSLVDGFTPIRAVSKDYYITDALSDRAVRDVEGFAKGDRPFMMYLAYTAPHWPLHAPEAVIQKYLDRYKDGWSALQKARYERQVALGLVDPKTTPLAPLNGKYVNQDDLAWNDLTPEQRQIEVRKMATHAAMIEIMDAGVGRLIEALKATGQYDNTVILFASDNGASPEVVAQPGYDRPSETRDGRKIQYGRFQTGIGQETTMAGIGAYWANAANTPWRQWKVEAYDGGVHSPFFVSWPKLGDQAAGRRVAGFAHVIDVTPTLLDLAGVAPDPKVAAPMDGVSVAPALRGGELERKSPLFFEHEGARAIISGKWKLVSAAPGRRSPAYSRWELYDLSTDRSETRDVSADHPAVAAQLAAQWSAWARDVGATPRREP